MQSEKKEVKPAKRKLCKKLPPKIGGDVQTIVKIAQREENVPATIKKMQ